MSFKIIRTSSSAMNYGIVEFAVAKKNFKVGLRKTCRFEFVVLVLDPTNVIIDYQ